MYKLLYAGKYIIVKGKTLARSVQIIEVGLTRFLKNTPKGRKETDYYHKFFTHILHNPFQKVELQIIFQSDNPLLLLKREQTELNLAKNDTNCLNQSFDAYIPQFTQVNGKKSWINRGYYLNFMDWKRKNS